MREEIEIWKDIEGYEELYQISNTGKIRSLNRHGKIKKTRENNCGYPYVALSKHNKPKTYIIHRLVLITFNGQSIDPNKNQVNHIDGNKLNNNLDNLEWMSSSENNWHKFNVLKYKGMIKSVEQLDLNGNLIQTFISTKQASKLLGISCSGISACLTGRMKTYKKHIWKYAK